MSDVERTLKPANENPWYILMTLYGEQDEDEIDRELHARNRAAWNAWACQGMSSEKLVELSATTGLEPEEFRLTVKKRNEIQSLFETCWTSRNGNSMKRPKIPESAEFVDLSRNSFKNIVSLAQFVFPNGIECEEAHFLSLLSFYRSTFLGTASFVLTDFYGSAWFDSARFIDVAVFSSSTFQQDATFGYAEFSNEAFFSGAVFTLETAFESVKFLDVAHFNDAIFGQQVESDAIHWSSFSDCQFDKPVNFSGARFFQSFPNFSGTIFHDRTTFSAVGKCWPKIQQSSPEEARTSCATIRHIVAKQGLPEDEHFFYRKEMHFAGQIGPWWQRLPYRAFGLISNYGESIWRPSVGLFALWLIPMLVYMAYFNWIAAFGGIKGQDIGTFDAFSLSFAAMFKFLGLQSLHFGAEYIRALPPFLEFLTAAQTLGGIVLLFFLGLGLRTRFRLR